MTTSLQESIKRQRESLAAMLRDPLANIARRCAGVWNQREKLDEVMEELFGTVPYCTFLYAVDTDGVQVSDNVSSTGLLPEHYGRDRSHRPYMKEASPAHEFLLSDAYISLRSKRPSVTALQRVDGNGGVLGYIGADIDLRDLPGTASLYEEPGAWMQIKGDPAVRGMVFNQTRVESLLDRSIDRALSILEELMVEHGMFQCVIHFSSSRATVWVLDDPYRYRILTHEALSDPDVCFAYPRCDYPADAVMPADAVARVLAGLRQLRFMDETIYLRSASLNIFNGMISLTFSCDGSHYMRYDEFLDKDMAFWVGSAA